MNTDKFFVQLDLDFSDIVINDSSLIFNHRYDDPSEDKRYGTIEYFNVDPVTKQAVIKKLPEQLQSIIRNVRVAVIKGCTIMPHIDHGGSVSVNYYLESGNAKTTFWLARPDAKTFRVQDKDTDNVYHYTDVIQECFYVAETHSCYLLNTGQIHDIQMRSADSVRKLLQLTFNHDVTYHEVLNKLLELNLLI